MAKITTSSDFITEVEFPKLAASVKERVLVPYAIFLFHYSETLGEPRLAEDDKNAELFLQV